MATLLHRKALMRIVKLVAATEDTFGVHTRGEQAIAGGAGVGATPGAYLSAPRGGVQAVLPGAPCTGAWLLLLRRWLDADTLSTAAGAAASGTADLTLALTTEAARHIDLATNPSSAAGGQAADDGTGSSAGQVSFLMRESLHPHYHRCTAHDTLSFPGARALWVFFDPRSQTHPDARLQFFAGSRGGVPVHSVSGEGSAFRPFVVNGDTLSFAFHAGGSADSAGWGYRMYVAPMLGLAWRNEGGVATGDASLEWACYALEFLLGDLQRCVEAGEQPHPATKAALHSSQVFNALVTYLRARGTPFKSRVVSLLTQLLKAPEAFPEHDPPDLALLHGMERAVFRHIEEQLSRRSGKSFPSSLLQLVELLITARVAARTLRRGGRTGAPGAPALERHVTLGSAEVQAPGGLAEVFLPHAVRQGLAEAAEADTASAVGSGAGAASSSVTLTPEQRAYLHEVQATDTCSSPPPDESAEATRSRPLSDVLMESMDIIETIHAQQQAAAAREGAALPPLEQAALHLLPLPPALLARCMLDAGWVQGPEEITAATLVSAAVSLGTWSADADQELVQWLTTITSPARRAVVAELTNRLKEAGEDPAAYDWDTACVGSAKSPLSINTSMLRLHPHGTDEPGPSGLPVHPEAPDDALAFPGIAPPNMPLPALRLRVALLQLLNRRLARVLPLIDVVRAAGKGGSGAANAASAGSSSGANQSFSLGHKLRMLAHCVFIDVKQQMLEVSIAASWTGSSGSGFSVQLDNREAFSHREAAAADPSLRAPDKAKSIAAQLYRGLLKSATGKVSGAKKDSKAVGEVLARGLRSQNDHRESLWKVEYRGEDGMDWGGLYRDCFSRVVDDLFSADLDVFLPCPNAEQGVGVNMDKWLPNPNHTTPSSLAFFVFVGRLIGVNLRHNMQLPFDLAPAVWDRILARPLPTHRRGKGSTAQLWELHDKREADRVTALEALSPE
ncbi:HERC1, partial [Symbiodinium sp. KB8]